MPPHVGTLFAISSILTHLASTLTLPLPPSVASVTNSNSASLLNQTVLTTPGADCFPPSFFSAELANSKDCAAATMKLPTSDEHGTFNSDSGTYDIFLLPLSKVSGKCNVTVSIRPGRREGSSWSAISNVAGQLGIVCSNGYFPNGNSGGITYMGAKGQIQILMEKTGAPPRNLRNVADGDGGGVGTS